MNRAERRRCIRARRRLLTPHTPAWYVRLSGINSRQAELSSPYAGKRCCTICGDVPATLYRPEHAPDLPVYLCANCMVIQGRMYGVTFTRIAEPGVR